MQKNIYIFVVLKDTLTKRSVIFSQVGHFMLFFHFLTHPNSQYNLKSTT